MVGEPERPPAGSAKIPGWCNRAGVVMPERRQPGRQEVVDGLGQTWASMADVGAALDGAEWELPTGCPGWSVKDQFSHVIGTERMLLGEEPPPAGEPGTGFVRNDIGAWNERWVAARRPLPGDDVLAEFVEVTDRRSSALRAMGDDDFAAPAMTPVGPGTYRDFMTIRLFDCWVHEQDVRRAVGRPGHQTGLGAETALVTIQGSLPRTVAKLAGAPEGASVAFAMEGDQAAEWAVGVEGGRGRTLEAVPSEVTAEVRTDLDTLVALACGRWNPDSALAEGRVTVTGDEALARRVVANLAFTF